MRGYAVVSTDTGHKSHNGAFDFSFEKDQQAYLDFAYQANIQVAALAKQIVAQVLRQARGIFVFHRLLNGRP